MDRYFDVHLAEGFFGGGVVLRIGVFSGVVGEDDVLVVWDIFVWGVEGEGEVFYEHEDIEVDEHEGAAVADGGDFTRDGCCGLGLGVVGGHAGKGEDVVAGFAPEAIGVHLQVWVPDEFVVGCRVDGQCMGFSCVVRVKYFGGVCVAGADGFAFKAKSKYKGLVSSHIVS